MFDNPWFYPREAARYRLRWQAGTSSSDCTRSCQWRIWTHSPMFGCPVPAMPGEPGHYLFCPNGTDQDKRGGLDGTVRNTSGEFPLRLNQSLCKNPRTGCCLELCEWSFLFIE